MATFSDTFTQGGQTQLHKFHMIRQVIGSTLKGGLALFVITFGLFIWSYHCWQDFWLLICCFKAWLRVEHLAMLPKGFFDESWLVDGKGVTHTVTDFHLNKSDFYQTLARNIGLNVLKEVFYSVLITLVGICLISMFWVKMGRKKKATKIISGFECVTPKLLKKQVLKNGTSPYTIAGVPIPKDAEFQHMMVTGTTGAGKSNMIHQLLQQIRDQGDQAIVVDTTGGIFARFFDEGRDVYLNPLDIRSAKWNMWDEAKADYVIDEIAEAMIPDSKSMESFWIQSARQLFGESFRFLKKRGQNSYKELIDMTLKIDLRQLQERLGNTTAGSILHPSIDKTALSVRASLANHLRVLEYLDESNEGLSLINFMKDNHKSWLFLSCETDQRAFLRPIFSLWLSLIIKGTMKRFENNGSRTWIIIDELASLNRLPALMTGLSEIRKYGGCFVLGFQDISQVEKIYGNLDAKTLSNLTGTKVLFRAVDTEVAIRVARYMGEQEKEVSSESISFGAHQMRDGVNLSNHVQTKPVVSVSQVMQLQNLEAYLKYPGLFPVSKVSFNYLKCSIQNLAFIAKPLKEKEEEGPEVTSQIIEEKSKIINTAQIINLKFNKNENDGENEDEIISKHVGSDVDLSAVVEVENKNSDELVIEDGNVEIFL